ncbi:hypothetical protein C8Q80DRAFT_98277 [Daedaleopsis nitida]|nr:hypothetical protein C8Q80DRAFT_98277 [Daedaleopsis nitida]
MMICAFRRGEIFSADVKAADNGPIAPKPGLEGTGGGDGKFDVSDANQSSPEDEDSGSEKCGRDGTVYGAGLRSARLASCRGRMVRVWSGGRFASRCVPPCGETRREVDMDKDDAGGDGEGDDDVDGGAFNDKYGGAFAGLKPTRAGETDKDESGDEEGDLHADKCGAHKARSAPSPSSSSSGSDVVSAVPGKKLTKGKSEAASLPKSRSARPRCGP